MLTGPHLTQAPHPALCPPAWRAILGPLRARPRSCSLACAGIPSRWAGQLAGGRGPETLRCKPQGRRRRDNEGQRAAPPLRPPGAASQAHLVWWASRVIFALSHFGRVNAMINPHRLSKYQHPELWKPRPRKAVLGGLRHMAVHCCTSHCHHQSPSLVWAPGSEKGWLRLQQHPQSGGLRSPRQLRPSPDRSGRGFGDAPSCPQRQAV
ncbi:uncharacterized protein LOC119872802 isoform X1 [Canis lupus familiaris]|uniref:uncharacterized protein LOC119872802 isoform X1 n=1 Tax=Canis lupus familiaris TaxID=9615 RepID=UPI0015F12BA2|nr:uncharacterized protein LOC119872802 isoform X1 [Canis lupus familiaris]XP_038438405.1 uncharacterized protein LOC119872802 isoform X1 [Canis lupus familiaris]XP_038528950.1 uncharacterized protein LOC119872802 isoform X1 [Canis lupus familiaris]